MRRRGLGALPLEGATAHPSPTFAPLLKAQRRKKHAPLPFEVEGEEEEEEEEEGVVVEECEEQGCLGDDGGHYIKKDVGLWKWLWRQIKKTLSRRR